MKPCLDAKIMHDGDPPFLKVARIDHAFLNGCHVFTSEEIPGLLIAHVSLQTATAQLPQVIADLIEGNLGYKCSVKLAYRLKGDEDNAPDEAVIFQKAAQGEFILTSSITAQQLRLLLTEKYKCRYAGKPMTPPYCTDDDLPTYYISPSGLKFSVPEPPNGKTYSLEFVKKIMEAGKLNVVVDLPELVEKKKEIT